MSVRTPIVEKIQLLLNKAENNANEHEAEAFYQAAMKLMMRHAIDESMLPGNERREEIVCRKVSLRARDELWTAKALLLDRLAKANRCEALVDKPRHQVLVYGYESDTMFVEMLYDVVLMQMAIGRTRGWREYQAATEPVWRESRFLWVKSFAYAFAVRVGERLQELSSEAAESTGRELVLRDRAQDVADHVAPLGTDITLRGTAGDGTRAGRDAADRADLTGGRNNLHGRETRQVGR